MQADRPKQFLPLAGKPVLQYSLELFAGLEMEKGSLVIVSHSDYRMACEVLLRPVADRFSAVAVVSGGRTRHLSSINGLAALEEVADSDIILIHDGARPLVSSQEVWSLVRRMQSNPVLACATLASPATETIAVSDSADSIITDVPDRSTLFAIKTPQALRGAYREGMQQCMRDDYTDLIAWAMDQNLPSGMAPSGPRNIKLTNPEDLPFLESLVGKSPETG